MGGGWTNQRPYKKIEITSAVVCYFVIFSIYLILVLVIKKKKKPGAKMSLLLQDGRLQRGLVAD